MRSPPITGLNGWALPAALWQKRMEDLSAQSLSSVQCFDPNSVQGDTWDSWAPGETPSPFAAACAATLDENEPSVLVGWSMGALIALECAHFWPDRVRALVLLNGTSRFCSAPDYPCGVPTSSLHKMMKRIGKQTGRRVLQDFFQRIYAPTSADAAHLQQLVEQAAERPASALYNGLRYLDQADWRTLVPHLTLPVRLVHGAADAVIPVDASRWLHDHLPHSEWFIEPGTPHALPLLDPAGFIGHIADFMLNQS